jgi:hypothetical protein
MELHYDTMHARMMQLQHELETDVYMNKFVVEQPLRHANRNIAYNMFANHDGSVVSVSRYIEPNLHHLDDNMWSAQVVKHAKTAETFMQTLSALVTGVTK